jgi:two-component system sensor histidine kinase PhoQ
MSLNSRIILSATLVLLIFITLTAAALERAFVDSTESALRDRLTSQLYALMAAADVTDDGILMPSGDLDALLGLPSSGVYAQITSAQGKTLWQSSSVLGAQIPQPKVLTSGEKGFTKAHAGSKDFYTFAYGVNWATDNSTIPLTFNITTDLVSFDKQISKYRTTLWGWLLAMAMLLLISQAAILRWGLSPLRKVGAELNRIEAGNQEKIEEHYPQEIEHLSRNINLLLQQERDQKTRYRDALGDLAHSLKTPLAVMQSGLSSSSDKHDSSMQEQITRMNTIVEYQLQRAATAGSASIGKTVAIKAVIDRLLESLNKVYRDKAITVNVRVDHDLMFSCDEGDLLELLGNLLDNAYKWCLKRIDIVAELQGQKLRLHVMDDGPGIEVEQVERLLQRGVRADQTTAGHGIGLSIVRSIVQAYKGELNIRKSDLGGCEVALTL